MSHFNFFNIIFCELPRVCFGLLVIDLIDRIFNLSGSSNKLRPDVFTWNKDQLTGGFQTKFVYGLAGPVFTLVESFALFQMNPSSTLSFKPILMLLDHLFSVSQVRV